MSFKFHLKVHHRLFIHASIFLILTLFKLACRFKCSKPETFVFFPLKKKPGVWRRSLALLTQYIMFLMRWQFIFHTCPVWRCYQNRQLMLGCTIDRGRTWKHSNPNPVVVYWFWIGPRASTISNGRLDIAVVCGHTFKTSGNAGHTLP